MSCVITTGISFNKNTCIPSYICAGHVRNNPWTFVYYDLDKIEEVLVDKVVETLGYSKESLYWDRGDDYSFLFSTEQEITEEEEANGYWETPASYIIYKIEDAHQYTTVLEKRGMNILL